MVRVAIEDAREQVASLFGVRPRQIVFTSGGTEAINAAVWGATRSHPGPVVCSPIEHAAVRDSSQREGPVLPLAVDGVGRIDVDSLDMAMAECRSTYGTLPSLVHCQWANHEVGTVQPVFEIVERCRDEGVLTHVDAVAAAGHLPLDLGRLGADLVSMSSHKMGGPPGVGALIVRRGLRLDPLIIGGEQERGRRAGFESVAAVLGFGAAAAELAGGGLELEMETARRQTRRLATAASATDGVTRYGDPDRRVPHIVCIGIEGVEAEPILLGLDQAGVAAHSGSSCSSEALEPSPVLAAMGVDSERSLRLSVGWSTTDDDVAAFERSFPGVVGRLRALRT